MLTAKQILRFKHHFLVAEDIALASVAKANEASYLTTRYDENAEHTFGFTNTSFGDVFVGDLYFGWNRRDMSGTRIFPNMIEFILHFPQEKSTLFNIGTDIEEGNLVPINYARPRFNFLAMQGANYWMDTKDFVERFEMTDKLFANYIKQVNKNKIELRKKMNKAIRAVLANY